jgi:hypothetical protein
MGLTSNYGLSKRVYLQIIGGKLAQTVEKETPGAVSRQKTKGKNAGQQTWELYHDRVSGIIKEMNIEKKDFGEYLDIHIEDVGDKFIVSLPVESKFFDSFCAKIGTADLSYTIELAPYSFEGKDGNKVIGMNLYQKGNPKADEKGKLPYFFSKENPMGKPFPSEKRISDREYKAFKLQERDFYCKYINGFKFNQDRINSPAETVSGSDDLPF